MDGSILCRGVDERGSLSVAGRTGARELVTADWFTVTLTGSREVGRSATVDLRDLRDLTELREVIRPELLLEYFLRFLHDRFDGQADLYGDRTAYLGPTPANPHRR